MRSEHYAGRRAVAGALRALADGIADGRIEVGGAVVGCHPDISLVVDAQPGGVRRVDVAVLHLSGEQPEFPALDVDRELSHPGG